MHFILIAIAIRNFFLFTVFSRPHLISIPPSSAYPQHSLMAKSYIALSLLVPLVHPPSRVCVLVLKSLHHQPSQSQCLSSQTENDEKISKK